MAISVTVNGVTAGLPYVVGKTAAQYASDFKTTLQALLPALTFNVDAAGQLVVQAPTGQELAVTTSGSPFTPRVDMRSQRADESDPVVVVIKNGVAEQTYRLSLDGAAFSYTAGATDQPLTYRTETIAEALRTSVEAAGYVVQRYGAVLTIRKTDGSPIAFDAQDTWNNQAMRAARGRVETTADLPQTLDPDVVLAVGDVRNGGYYVRYTYRVAADVSGDFEVLSPTAHAHAGWQARESAGAGAYEETFHPSARTTFTPGSMPHLLVREADGTFTFKPADWATRRAGDERSVPVASFVGKPITDVFFFRNRMGLLTDENVVLSKSGAFFDFWADTAKEVLDGDPIDLLVTGQKVSLLRYAQPFNSNLMLFGDTAQWVVTSQGALTPRTVSVQPTTDFLCSERVRPVSVGQTVYFASERKPWASVWEYYATQDSFQNTAQEVTQHVPRYIPEGLRQLVASPSESVLVGLTDGDRRSAFVYKYLWVGDEKVQECWGRWTFGGEVVNAGFMGSVLYLAFRHSDGLYLEKLDLQDPIDNALVDRRGHPGWRPYTMVYEFSPLFLRPEEGKNIVGAINKVRTARVFYTKCYALKTAVIRPYAGLTVRGFPDAARAEVFRSPGLDGEVRVMVGGDARNTLFALVNDSPGQCQIKGVEFEMLHQMRARRV